jgi:hypothetical protein
MAQDGADFLIGNQPLVETLTWWRRGIQQSRVLVGAFSENNRLECAEEDVKVKCNRPVAHVVLI